MYGLSRQQVARALRNFTLMGAFWAVYGPNATVTGPVLSGFCLKAGLRDSDIAFLVSLASLVGVSQLLSYFFTRDVRNKRLMMVALGLGEITGVTLVVAAGLWLAPQHRFIGIATLLVVGLLFGNAVSPTWSSWMSNVIPPDVRASYIGRRMFILTAVGGIYLLIASRVLDIVAPPHNFLIVFGVGWIGGIAGYIVALVTPYPSLDEARVQGLRALLAPLRDRQFSRLLGFAAVATVAGMLPAAFYSIYMLRYLGLSYQTVAIYANITLITTMIGYRAWGAAAQRYGHKPVIQLLVVPAAAIPLIWALTGPSNDAVMIPLASALSGLCASGISVAISGLLFKITPQGRDVTEYFAVWAAANTTAGALGPFISGLLKNALGTSEVSLVGLEFTSPQIIFLVATAASLLPVMLSFALRESGTASPMYILGQFRGNLFSVAYNFAIYARTTEDEQRADRLRALGRTHSPLALGALLQGLGDSSPAVRQGAVEGLGESGLAEGLDPLLAALQDEQAEVRPAAAEALGRLGMPEGVGPLIRALYDDDPRVRSSAAQALGEIGGPHARDALYQALLGRYGASNYSALVDALSRTGDLRVVEPAFAGLAHVRNPVVRMQLLNAIGRALRERNHFYRLRMTDRLGRAALVERMMARIVRLARVAQVDDRAQRRAMIERARTVAQAAAQDDRDGLRDGARGLADLALTLKTPPPVVRAAARSVLLYLRNTQGADLEDEELVFLTIALTSMLRHLSPRPRDHIAPARV